MKKPKRPPHEQLTTKHNGLSTMQEVTYRKEFKKADNATGEQNRNKK